MDHRQVVAHGKSGTDFSPSDYITHKWMPKWPTCKQEQTTQDFPLTLKTCQGPIHWHQEVKLNQVYFHVGKTSFIYIWDLRKYQPLIVCRAPNVGNISLEHMSQSLTSSRMVNDTPVISVHHKHTNKLITVNQQILTEKMQCSVAPS